MSASRLAEYEALVLELQNRYQDLSAPVRHSILMTAAMALADAFCLEVSKRRMTEDEFARLARTAYRKVRGH